MLNNKKAAGNLRYQAAFNNKHNYGYKHTQIHSDLEAEKSYSEYLRHTNKYPHAEPLFVTVDHAVAGYIKQRGGVCLLQNIPVKKEYNLNFVSKKEAWALYYKDSDFDATLNLARHLLNNNAALVSIIPFGNDLLEIKYAK